MLRATPARLACLRHAASVYPEPGSNSQTCNTEPQNCPQNHRNLCEICVLLCVLCVAIFPVTS
ncbi:hypothetical protein COU95_01860 [Candidatus Shapirobacteria bacterium CG10_big_fil_rev_8_21_14_0_10_40_9]|uniref:Uncharacterized protein n=1 Tax=Candidatus Shapirobacteria bacterium CG10_big_fil_rev_8_21_14_0_10_40_9 TaxID=1974888 RepID=A0A2M8L3P7_9BACT|nr:MAG: hypothetical protein COU95_01860 [Candidatus Shapirobacteria bacterium CG10_big_fil_rev_8_21_14_0_10_40_9]